MKLNVRRVRAIMLKELRDYSRNRPIIWAMFLFPVIFTVQPLISIFAATGLTAAALSGRHELLFMLGVPILVPATLAAYAVAGERLQETLEPVLETPITREEFLVGKALAVFVPSVIISYIVFAAYIVVVSLAKPDIAPGLFGADDIIVQIVFTPLLAAFSIWVGIAISTRAGDPRTAQQLSVLSSLPVFFIAILLAFNVIAPSLELAIFLGALLLIADIVGWRLIVPLFDRERLISGAH